MSSCLTQCRCVVLPTTDWYNYPIGLRGEVPEQIFLDLKAEFAKKLPFEMAYWEYDVNYKVIYSLAQIL